MAHESEATGTFEEQQEARQAYQELVRSTKGRAVNLNPTIVHPNPAKETGYTTGDFEDPKDEVTAEEIIAAADPDDADLAKAAKEVTSGEPNVITVEEFNESIRPEGVEDDAEVEAPSQSSNKGEWVAHRIDTHGLSEAEANEMTKQELIDLK